MGEFFALMKSYGPGMAPWVLLFALITFFAGKGGRAAMSNVTTLMAEGEALRGRMKDALHDCNEQLREKDRVIQQLTADMETARLTLRKMRQDLEDFQDQVQDLTRQLRRYDQET